MSLGKLRDSIKGIDFTFWANVANINLEDGKSDTSKLMFNFGTLTENIVSGKLGIAQSMQFDPTLPGGLRSSSFNSTGLTASV